MNRERTKTYLDNSALSAYVAWPPSSPVQHTQWAFTQALFETAEKRGIRFVSSRFITEEAEAGHKGAAARRTTALRRVTLIPETEPIRQKAQALTELIPSARGRRALAADARHFACAIACKAKMLVTWDTKDFERLTGLAMSLGWEDLPDIVTPPDAAMFIGAAVIDNPPNLRELLNRRTPWIQKILKENEAIQIKLCRPFIKKYGLS